METIRDEDSFVVILTHEEVLQIAAAGTVTVLIPHPIGAAIIGAVNIIVTVDVIGGNNGVEISGDLIAPQTLMVLPRAKGIWGTVVPADQQLAKFIANFTTPVRLVKLLISTNPFGAGAGEVNCDEKKIGDEETLIMFTEAQGRVALMGYRGIFTPDQDKGGRIMANRQEIGPWELFNLKQHADGWVSLQSAMDGRWMCADRYIAKRPLVVDRSDQDEWEKFKIHYLGNGRIALEETEHYYARVA